MLAFAGSLLGQAEASSSIGAAGVQVLGPSSTAFPETPAEAGSKAKKPGPEPVF